MLRPGYFSAGGLLGLGELIYVRMQPLPPRGVRRAAPEPVRMALLMVTGAGARGAAAVRLVQDFGTTDAPAEAAAPSPPLPAPAAAAGEAPGRRRGRPAGSRSRKAPTANGHDAGLPTI